VVFEKWGKRGASLGGNDGSLLTGGDFRCFLRHFCVRKKGESPGKGGGKIFWGGFFGPGGIISTGYFSRQGEKLSKGVPSGGGKKVSIEFV